MQPSVGPPVCSWFIRRTVELYWLIAVCKVLTLPLNPTTTGHRDGLRNDRVGRLRRITYSWRPLHPRCDYGVNRLLGKGVKSHLPSPWGWPGCALRSNGGPRDVSGHVWSNVRRVTGVELGAMLTLEQCFIPWGRDPLEGVK